MKLKEAVKKAEESIEETLACCDFPSEHWARIHINNAIERLNREIRRHNRRVGSFPNGKSAPCLHYRLTSFMSGSANQSAKSF